MNNIIGSYNAYFKDFEWPYAFTVTPGANNYVMLDRLGKRWIAESTFLSPHVDGTNSKSSTTRRSPTSSAFPPG